MKKLSIICAIILSTIGLQAREFEAGERLYFNGTPNDAPWWMDHTVNPSDAEYTRLWAYFFNGSSSQWVEALRYGTNSVFYAELTGTANWTHVILTRHRGWVNSPAFDSNCLNQTGDIDLNAAPSDKNYIENFYYDYGGTKNGSNWWNLSLEPAGSPVSAASVDNVTKEVVSVCKSSSGDPFSLQPKLAGTPLTYDYNHTAANAWFKWNGSAWVALDGQAVGFYSTNNVWGFEGPGSLNETIGAADSHTYYFLWAAKPSRRRFVEVAVVEECTPTCEITDFGVVTSNVNAHDSTYTLDGIVAFKDATGQTLRISVTDAKGEHHVDYTDPTTPFIFSLPGLYADGTTGMTATATFIGTPYSRTSNAYDAPNAIIGVKTTYIHITHGVDTTLIPDTPGTDGFKWNDGNTTDHTRAIPAYGFDTTIIYTYYEYEKAPEVGGNLIVNGDYSSPGFDYGPTNYDADVTTAPFSTISDYHYWGKDVTDASDFYTTMGNINGGMAIVTDANAFWKRFTKQISSKQGTHFALFDADNSGEKAAWKVETSAEQPDLKLAKGTNYMFSFWVANINNYGEMNNAAILQFEISYSTNNGATWSTPEKLGNPINLNNYPDNLWHQNSHVYVATVDADKIRISVKDLNNSSNPGGNDFALDDIRFQPISVVSQAIKHCQRFVVNVYEAPCVFSGMQLDTLRPQCPEADHSMYGLRVTLQYDKPQGALTLTDNGVVLFTEDTVTEATTKVILIDSLAASGEVHHVTAKFTKPDAHNVDKGCEISGTYTAPGIPAFSVSAPSVPAPDCGVTTYDLEVSATFAYASGTQLLCYWDGVPHAEATKTITYGPSTTVTTTLKGLAYDGADHTLVVKTNNSTYDCQESMTVKSPASFGCGVLDTAICEGETMTWLGTTYPITPYVGVDTFVNGFDSLRLTIYLSDHVYSKWTDVLFVSNKEGRFTAYQWLADGIEMPGETQQHLYNPNGLSGSKVIYQCRLLTTDGKTICTCPLTFDEAIPSRTQNTENAVQARMVYDTMGRRIEGQPTKGIYIVVETIDGQTHTTKLFVNE